MVIKHAAWVHGSAAHFSSEILTKGYVYEHAQSGCVVTSVSGTAVDPWILLPIPTPVIVDGVRLKAGSAIIRFQTGSLGRITGVFVNDGEKNIAFKTDLNLHSGHPSTYRLNIPGDPEVRWGTTIGVTFKFDGTGPDANIWLFAAGIDFFA